MRRDGDDAQARLLELGDDLAGQVAARRVRLDDRKGALDGHEQLQICEKRAPYAVAFAIAQRRAISPAAMLAIDNIIVRIAGREILNGASANLPAGRRIGLVGRNGAGKSTLLKVILGQLHADDGDVSAGPAPGASARWRRKRPARDVSLLDTVLEADTERTALLAEAEHETDGHRLGDIYHRLDAIDAYTAPARAAEILAGLGFSAEDQLRPCCGIFRRLAHARGAGGDPVLRARSAAARRADQLSRPRRRAVAGEFPPALSRHGADRQP